MMVAIDVVVEDARRMALPNTPTPPFNFKRSKFVRATERSRTIQTRPKLEKYPVYKRRDVAEMNAHVYTRVMIGNGRIHYDET